MECSVAHNNISSVIAPKKQYFTGYRWVAGKKVMGI